MLGSFAVIFSCDFKIELALSANINTRSWCHTDIATKLCIGVINNAHLINYSEQIQ